MPRATKVCRVCGKTYEACRTVNKTGVFRWRDVACSPECGAKYLAQVIASREPPADTSVDPHAEPAVKEKKPSKRKRVHPLRLEVEGEP